MNVNDLNPKDFWIPLKSKNDIYAPQNTEIMYANVYIKDHDIVKFWYHDLLIEDEKVDETSVFLACGNILYVFNVNEKVAWYRQLDQEVEGYEEIPCNDILFKKLLDIYFNSLEFTILLDYPFYKELALLMIGCTNTEISNTYIEEIDDLTVIISELIGYQFSGIKELSNAG